jgi:hypothetical protein
MFGDGLGGGLFGGNNAKGKAPTPPDFMSAAHPNTSNPLGGQSWNGNTSSIQFGGQAGDTFNKLLGGMNSAAGMDPAAAGKAAEDKVYGALKSRLDPAWNTRQSAFDAQLANQGLQPGTDAYNNSARTFGQQRNDAYGQAAGQAIGLGQQEQAQQRANSLLPFGQASEMMNMLHQQGNNLGAGLNAAQMQYAGQMIPYNQQQNNKGTMMGGLGALGGAYLGGPGGAYAGYQVGKNVDPWLQGGGGYNE